MFTAIAESLTVGICIVLLNKLPDDSHKRLTGFLNERACLWMFTCFDLLKAYIQSCERIRNRRLNSMKSILGKLLLIGPRTNSIQESMEWPEKNPNWVKYK